MNIFAINDFKNFIKSQIVKCIHVAKPYPSPIDRTLYCENSMVVKVNL